MAKRMRLSEMEKNRINELRLRALICQMLKSTNNNFGMITEFIKYLENFFEFNVNMILEIIREIFDMRYEPTTDEIIKINLLLGLTIKEIADKLRMKESTVKMHIYRNKNNTNTIILYPRLKQEQSHELRKFLKQYYKLYVPADKIIKV